MMTMRHIQQIPPARQPGRQRMEKRYDVTPVAQKQIVRKGDTGQERHANSMVESGPR